MCNTFTDLKKILTYNYFHDIFFKKNKPLNWYCETKKDQIRYNLKYDVFIYYYSRFNF